MKQLKDRLTIKEDDGRIKVRGMDETNELEKITACVQKLYEYENLAFHPNEIEMLLKLYDEMVVRQDKLLAKIERYAHSNKLLEKELAGYRKTMPSSCPVCHKPNFKNDKFCCHCGEKIRR